MFASARLKVDDVGGRDGLLTLAAPPTPHTRRWAFAAGPRWHSRRPPVRASLSLERGPAAAVRPTGRERIEPQASKTRGNGGFDAPWSIRSSARVHRSV